MAMGSSLGSLLANILMAHLGEKFLLKIKNTVESRLYLSQKLGNLNINTGTTLQLETIVN